MNSKYYNYSINMNGKKIKHGDDYFKDYYPDLIANDSIAFLRASKRRFARKPVLLVMSFPAPHGPEDSAPQYSHLFFNVTTHHTPTYDFAPNPDKQWILRVTDKMKPIHRQFTDLLMTKRLQTLQSVDMAVDRVYQELKALGELDNTYLVYTSDHGYHLGQFGLVKGKSFPFEFDIRVPFLVRGPGVEPGTVVDDIVLNIDLAPTFLDMGGVDPAAHMDGRSLLPLLQPRRRRAAAAHWPDTFLVESSGRRESQAHLMEERLRAQKYSREMNEKFTTAQPNESSSESADFDYDSEDDFLEIDDEDEDDDTVAVSGLNRSSEPFISNESHNPVLEATLEKALSADDSSNEPSYLSESTLINGKAARLAAECTKSELRAPCSEGRKWKCVLINGRWRKHKCKYEPDVSESQPKMSTKKCACFTPSGLVYTRLETDGNIARRPVNSQKENITRSKRSISNDVFEPNTVDSILEENPSIGHLSFKSETLNENEQRNFEDKIDKLIKETEAFLDAYERTKDNLGHKRIRRRAQHWNHNKHKQKNDPKVNDSTLECKVEKNGSVNCSQVIYNDLKAWHNNRLSLEDQIRQLRTKLEDLKEIKRHLKNSKPAQVEVQTINPSYIINHDHSDHIREPNNTDSVRKSRIHRLKPKHRNPIPLEKKLKQTNEYSLPTQNTNVRDNIFEIQMKNDSNSATSNIYTFNVLNETELFTNRTKAMEYLPKPQVTTVIINSNTHNDFNNVHEGTLQSISTAYDEVTTEFNKILQSSSMNYIQTETSTVRSTTSSFISTPTTTVNLETESTTSKLKDEIQNKLEKNETLYETPFMTRIKPVTSTVSNLGPTRFDASEYEKQNPNKGNSNNMSLFDKPSDIFQKRLHPLFIENEDKHVCYCEENRKIKGPGPAAIEAAQRAKEEKRKLKEQRLRKKLRKAKKKAELERLCESERMNCFRHDNDHWRTAPLWTAGPFCFCMSASNNTYNCVRTINSTHNLLYCEFVTGLSEIFNEF
ncbi:unnamed protein product [Leptidea sinapis]|uniref:Sulfatase N-terminal domain-containing protein n=1 Tax=Leptidea sinapis TaxID=189913 RepID=A0A5E4PRM3_9NEOP|nr:unnamed protein product [Leptidea sinapis]